jgi:hypothetical protein
VIGTTCLTSGTNQRSPAEYFIVVGNSGSLEKVSTCSFSRNEVACFSNYSKMPAAGFNLPNNLNNSFHDSSVGLVTREFSFVHENSIFYVGMRSLKKKLLNQIDYVVNELKRTMKREFELLLNRGRLFYTKCGMFGINVSNYYQFGCEVFKLAPAAQPPWSNQIQLSKHRAPGSESWSMESIFLGRWIISIEVMTR